jgi:DNA-binding NtrC family response regulator
MAIAPMSDQVLIVDDDPTQRRLLEAMVEKLGFATVLAEDGEAALRLTEGDLSDLRAIVLDLVMPGLDGMEVMRRWRRQGIRVPVIVQTASSAVETAVAAMRTGAFDFVVKPVSPERLAEALNGALKVEALERKRVRRVRNISLDSIETKSPVMQKTLNLARKAAASDIPVLIEGESGVGKELIARAIHRAGRRSRKPFVTVNCGAIPENMVESILFGHEKGAFPGATERHVGKFVEADGGTLFLDDIADLPANVQVKLLRSVQEGEVEPIGAKCPVKVDIRLISATNQDLMEEVLRGRFREDLFYRLNVFPIRVPPLRERKEDIPIIVRNLIERFAETLPSSVTGITPAALQLLSAYDWPGNVRELENAIFRAIVLSERSVLSVHEFPQIQAQAEGPIPTEEPGTPEVDQAVNPQPPASPRPQNFIAVLNEEGHVRTLQELEHELIRIAIDHYGAQMSEVARRLGIGRSTLYRKLKELGINVAERAVGEDA